MTETINDPVGIFHPSKPLYRFTILIFVSFLTFGSYFAYDIVGAISPTLVEELGSTIHEITPEFIWDEVPGVQSYHFQIANNQNFDPLHEEATNLTATRYSLQRALSNWNTYYWRVRVQDAKGNWGEWSEVWRIKVNIKNPVQPSLSSPSYGKTVSQSRPDFVWNKFPGAKLYHFQIADNQNFDPLHEENYNLKTTYYSLQKALINGKTYYWRVRAKDKGGNWEEWSEAWIVKIDLDAPLVPSLLSPSKEATIDNNTPDFTWSDVPGAKLYHFQIADNQNFGLLHEEDYNLTTTNYILQKALTYGKIYYWRVQAKDKMGNWEEWSKVRILRIDADAPVVPDLIRPGRTRLIVGISYSMYHIAALFVLIGGFLIDKLGTRKASISFSLLIFAGAVIVWVARSIPMLLTGRFIFGAGSEPLIVAQSAILARWFKGKELALSFGIALTVSRLGTLFAFNTGEMITDYFGSYRYALFGAVICCLISLGANVVYIIMDRRSERILRLKDGTEEKIVFKDIKEFKPTFWYVTMLCVTFYSAIFPFTALSTDFFVDKWGIAKVAEASGGFLSQVFNSFLHMFSTAGGVTSIIIFASMILAPFAGHLVDKIGKRATLMIIGSLIMIPSHLLMGITKVYPAFPMISLGAAFVLVPAAMWPSIPLIVRKERVGTAFGLMTAIQTIGLGLFPFLNTLLRDITQTYTSSQIMFASLGLFGLVFAILLKKADAREDGGLERIEKKARAA